jgi:hypothetical protein
MMPLYLLAIFGKTGDKEMNKAFTEISAGIDSAILLN